MPFFAIVASLLALSLMAASVDAAPLEGGVDEQRIKQIATDLPEGPFAFGPKITDRAAWDALAKKSFAGAIANAEKKLAAPMPAMTEEIYSLYKKTGQRTKQYNDVRYERHGRIGVYLLAECVENKGRFIKPLEDAIADICTEPTWVYNFHDPGLDDWRGKRTTVDLGAILPAHDMATASVLLGDKLSVETRKLIETNCRKRILEPYKAAVAGITPLWWVNAHMNWNAVCHNGVIGTALAIESDKHERAYYIACAEKYLPLYLQGFGPDGYCDEGMGYWNYGYSNFIEACELVWQQTGGKVDLYDLPNARAAGQYPAHIEIFNGLAPSYADCGLNPKPDTSLAAFVNRRYRLGYSSYGANLSNPPGGMPAKLMYACPNSATSASPPIANAGYELHSYFEHGGVLNCRPAAGSSCRLGVSLKGGHNAEAHNHNDLGTFVVAIGKELPILDPGGEVYTSRTFGKHRYDSNLLNSFGHPVPMVAGQLQRPGQEAHAEILRADFSDSVDTYAMDISSAYPVPELTKLTRTFTYERTGEGSLTVVDEVAFKAPKAFAGALITYGKWEKDGETGVIIKSGDESVKVNIDTGGVPFELVSETINEQTHSGAKPTRIGINLKEPIAAGKVVLTITPAAKK